MLPVVGGVDVNTTDSAAGQPQRLPISRWSWFWLRRRARAGLVPGEVTTAALLAGRAERTAALWIVVAGVILIVVLSGLALLPDELDEVPRVVVSVVAPEPGDESTIHRVVLDGGEVVDFDRDPGVQRGDLVVLQSHSPLDHVGLVRDGALVEAANRDTGPEIGMIVFAVGLGASVSLSGGIRARRAHIVVRGIERDLQEPTTTATGHYLGSWVWRALAGTTSTPSLLTSPLPGVPVAIEDDAGHLTWFAAPVRLLDALTEFEAAIADGNRQVAVTYHPTTRAIGRLDATEGGASVTFDHAVDAFAQTTGLSLVKRLRRRHPELPDR